jgi:DNA polymerase (family 10)
VAGYLRVDEMMTNQQIAAVFDEIASMLERKKDNIFKIRAYRKVARAIGELAEPVGQLVADDRLHEIPGVGPAISKKITELVNTGRLEYLERLRKELFGQSHAVGS